MTYLCTDAGLTEEEVLIENATTPETVETIQRTTLLLRMKDGITTLATVLKIIEVSSKVHRYENNFSFLSPQFFFKMWYTFLLPTRFG